MKRSHIERVFAWLTILTMQTVYMKISNSIVDLLLSGALVVVGVLMISEDGKVRYKFLVVKNLLINILTFLSIPMMQILFVTHEFNYNAMLLIVVLCTVLFSVGVLYFSQNKDSIENYLENFTDAVCFITVCSLILYLTGQVFHMIAPTSKVTIDWGGRISVDSYFWLLFTPQAHSGYHSFRAGRFTGIFTEAPMCSFVLCCALIQILFVSKKKIIYWKFAVLLIAIYVSVSTTGYIIATAAIALYILQKKSRSVFLRKLKIVAIPFALGISCFVVYRLYTQKALLDVASVRIRDQNFNNAMQHFLRSPLWGNGFKSDTVGSTGGDTSVLSQVLQNGGILFAIWYFSPIIVVLRRYIKEKNWNYSIAILLYIAMLYVTVVTYTPLSILIVSLFFVLMQRRMPRKI